MMHTVFAILALVAYVLAALCLLVYRKDGARHRRRVSWVAYVLLVVMGGSAIKLMLNHKTVGFFDAGQAVLLSLFIIRARGNVARLLWSNTP